MTTRIIIADDQPKVRFALRVILESRPDTKIIGEAGDAQELLSLLRKSVPSVVIIDWMLPGLAEAGSIQTIRRESPNIVVIILSGRPELCIEAQNDGADAFISKIDPPDRLMAALDQTAVQTTKVRTEPAEKTPS